MKKHVWLVLLSGLFLGCDQQPSVSVTPQVPQTPGVEQRPTTQELLHGSRKRIDLAPIPATAQVPASWKIDTSTELPLLTGPTPYGEIHIMLSHKGRLNPESKAKFDDEALKLLYEGALAEMRKNPGEIKLVPMRSLGGAKVLEQQEVREKSRQRVLDEKGDSYEIQRMRWTLTLFVPGSGEYETYELSFPALTVQQYEVDKELLRDVLNSVEYTPGPATQASP